jgi:hypothetical protein
MKVWQGPGELGLAVLGGEAQQSGSVSWGYRYMYVRGVARCLIQHGVGEAWCGEQECLNEASTTFKEESDKAGKKVRIIVIQNILDQLISGPMYDWKILQVVSALQLVSGQLRPDAACRFSQESELGLATKRRCLCGGRQPKSAAAPAARQLQQGPDGSYGQWIDETRIHKPWLGLILR